MPLHTRYIPQDFDHFYGNDALVESLTSVLDREEDIPQVFLFYGNSGCGKSTLALILKKELEIHDLDFYSINCSDKGNIDDVRKIISRINYAPNLGDQKMFLLEEIHRASPQARETLLELFTNLPKHVIFVLCTTEPQTLKTTLKRRCHDYKVESLKYDDMSDFIDYILEKEKVAISDTIFEKLIDVSEGSPGIVLKALDKIIDIGDEDLILEVLETTSFDLASIKDICQLLLKKDDKKWDKMRKLLDELQGEPESNRIAILNYLNKVLLGDRWADSICNMMACLEDGPYIYSRKTSLNCALFLACKE